MLSAKSILISFWMDLNRDEAAPIFYYERQARIGLVQPFGRISTPLSGLSVTSAHSPMRRRTLDSTPRRLFGVALSHKAMGDASSINERAQDLTAVIDPYGFGSRGARKIDRSEMPIVQ
jgi:hypothetical protein